MHYAFSLPVYIIKELAADRQFDYSFSSDFTSDQCLAASLEFLELYQSRPDQLMTVETVANQPNSALDWLKMYHNAHIRAAENSEATDLEVSKEMGIHLLDKDGDRGCVYPLLRRTESDLDSILTWQISTQPHSKTLGENLDELYGLDTYLKAEVQEFDVFLPGHPLQVDFDFTILMPRQTDPCKVKVLTAEGLHREITLLSRDYPDLNADPSVYTQDPKQYVCMGVLSKEDAQKEAPFNCKLAAATSMTAAEKMLEAQGSNAFKIAVVLCPMEAQALNSAQRSSTVTSTSAFRGAVAFTGAGAGTTGTTYTNDSTRYVLQKFKPPKIIVINPQFV